MTTQTSGALLGRSPRQTDYLSSSRNTCGHSSALSIRRQSCFRRDLAPNLVPDADDKTRRARTNCSASRRMLLPMDDLKQDADQGLSR